MPFRAKFSDDIAKSATILVLIIEIVCKLMKINLTRWKSSKRKSSVFTLVIAG